MPHILSSAEHSSSQVPGPGRWVVLRSASARSLVQQPTIRSRRRVKESELPRRSVTNKGVRTLPPSSAVSAGAESPDTIERNPMTEWLDFVDDSLEDIIITDEDARALSTTFESVFGVPEDMTERDIYRPLDRGQRYIWKRLVISRVPPPTPVGKAETDLDPAEMLDQAISAWIRETFPYEPVAFTSQPQLEDYRFVTPGPSNAVRHKDVENHKIVDRAPKNEEIPNFHAWLNENQSNLIIRMVQCERDSASVRASASESTTSNLDSDEIAESVETRRACRCHPSGAIVSVFTYACARLAASD